MPNAILQKKLMRAVIGPYMTGPETAIEDPLYLAEVQQFKRLVASQLVPLSKDDIRRKIPDGPMLVSRKIDGEFTAVVYAEGEIFTLNPGGTVRIGLPVLNELQEMLRQANVKRMILAGEIYVQFAETRRCRVHDAISVIRQPLNQSQLSDLKLAIFDIISEDGVPISQPYSQTWTRLKTLFQNGKDAHLVDCQQVNHSAGVQQLFQKWVERESAEGLVVRSELAGGFKIKPLYTLDAAVIGFTESTDDRIGMMHDLLLAVRRKDGAYQVLGRVGGGFSDEQRRQWLSDLRDMAASSEYAEVNSDHVAYQMVRPELVVEISCLDLVAQNTRGRPVNRMTLRWDESEGWFRVVRRLPLVSVISPQFLRIREDKSAANVDDVRIQQIDDLVPVPFADLDTAALSLPKSELLQREVYVKTMRGEKMVRKFLLWATHKEQENEYYPAYVAYLVDYSPSRKVPLTREMRVSNSQSQITALWHELKEQNVKGGWTLVGDPTD